MGKTLLHFHPDSVFRSQGKAGHGDDGVIVDYAQGEACGDCGKQKHSFHHREARSNALSWASAEGEVGEAGLLLRRFTAPALGFEVIRISEEAGVSLQDPLAHDEVCAGWNSISLHLELFRRFPRKTPGRWI